MNTTFPDAFLPLLEGPVVVNIGTIMQDGQPQVHPIWCNLDDGDILVNSAKGRAKDKNMRARPQVTVLAVDPRNPYRYMEVRGTVIEITEDGADKHIDDLAELYMGKRPYPFRAPGEVRVSYRIRPKSVHTFG